jgi:HK97 family phage major capsid protein
MSEFPRLTDDAAVAAAMQKRDELRSKVADLERESAGPAEGDVHTAARKLLAGDSIDRARGILDSAEAGGRVPTVEERSQFDAIMADADKIEERYIREEKLALAEHSLRQSMGRQTEAGQPGRLPDGIESRGGYIELKGPRGTPEYRSAFSAYLTRGAGSLSPAEQRALSAENDIQGGYLVAPQETLNQLIKGIDNAVVVRQLATKFTVTGAESLGAPSLDADPADADWTSEIATGSEDTSMAFGKRELHPRPLAKRIKVSRKLLSRMPAAETYVRQRLEYKFGVAAEKGYMTGDGNNKPLGLFVASAQGITTGRDVQTGSATSITADALIDAKYALKQPYQNSPNLRWLFHRDAVKVIAKLKDSTNNYIWQPNLQAGQPDRLLNVPVLMSEYVPNTFTTGLYVGVLGDLSYYWIADADTFAIQRLVELYAETNQVGFIGRLETDGMPVLEEAFVRLKTN